MFLRLRSPKAPDGNTDMGKHEFIYALFPHQGKVVLESYYCNHMVKSVPIFICRKFPSIWCHKAVLYVELSFTSPWWKYSPQCYKLYHSKWRFCIIGNAQAIGYALVCRHFLIILTCFFTLDPSRPYTVSCPLHMWCIDLGVQYKILGLWAHGVLTSGV